MGTLIWFIYGQPLKSVAMFIIFLVILWAVITRFVDGNCEPRIVWLAANALVFAVSLLAILYLTIYSRNTIGEMSARYILVPFHTFREAEQQPELYRSMVMNIFLFVPLGLSLPHIIPIKGQAKVKFALSIALALVLSISIEWSQYRYGLGLCEVDDVIMNTLGTAIGAMSYIIGFPRKEK